MSVEIANVLHAMAFLNLANVDPADILVKGFGIASVVRAAQGVYAVTLQVPLDFDGGIAVIQHAAATSRIVVAQLQPLADRPDGNNLQINGYAPTTGLASDTGEAYLMVYRYPTAA